MVQLERIPLSAIRKAAVYVNSGKKTLREIVAEQQPDIALTAAFYDPGRWKPVCPVKADGKVLFADPTYHYWAIAWDSGPDVREVLVPPGGSSARANYVANCLLVREGKPQPTLYYGADAGGRRGRVAVGLTDTEWIIYAAADGSAGACTPEELRDHMARQGCRFAVMMDGGGKVNVYQKAAGVLMEGRDPSQTLILLWLNHKEEKPVNEKKTVVLDAGHDASNLANKSPDGSYYENAFTLDMAKRIRGHLERCGVEVTETRPDGKAVSLAQRCAIANGIQGLDLFVSLHSNAAGGSRWSSAKGWSAYLYGAGGAREQAAQAILKAVRAVGVTVRSAPIVYDPSLYVLKHTAAPAILIEHGFHTNQEDTANLKDSAWRAAVAAAQARGIADYLGIAWVPGETPETPEDPATPTETEQAVAWITESGIMQGDAAGDLMLDQPLTRRQYAVMEYRKHLLDLQKKEG